MARTQRSVPFGVVVVSVVVGVVSCFLSGAWLCFPYCTVRLALHACLSLDLLRDFFFLLLVVANLPCLQTHRRGPRIRRIAEYYGDAFVSVPWHALQIRLLRLCACDRRMFSDNNHHAVANIHVSHIMA